MNIVFLDIDGVLQPYDAEYRFMYLNNNIVENLSKKYNVDYSKYNFYDVAATYYEWDEQAIYRLKYILDETNSKLIASTDWRSINDPHKIKNLLKMHSLDNYWIADNIILEPKPDDTLAYRRAKEIKNSLDKYNINNFVILDDLKELCNYYPNNCVITNNIISINNMNECIKILKRKK